MTLKPYKQRVVSEREDLAEEISNLTDFLSGDIFGSLASEDQRLLTAQREAMTALLGLLDHRISRF